MQKELVPVARARHDRKVGKTKPNMATKKTSSKKSSSATAKKSAKPAAKKSSAKSGGRRFGDAGPRQ